MDLSEIIECRLSAQGLTSQKYNSVASIISDSLAVQAQDLELSRYSFGLRTGFDDREVSQQLRSEKILRTHVLRPTWHWVLAEDIRWLIDLTGEKIISSQKSFQYKLGIDETIVSESFSILKNLLDNSQLTRKEIASYLPKTNYNLQGQVVGHILLMAEARGLICSGTPNANDEHTYALLDQVVPFQEKMEKSKAIENLVLRFINGRCVITLRDLTRWVNISKTDLLRALNNHDIKSFRLNDIDHWYIQNEKNGIMGSWLMPTFDEAILSHDQLNIPFIQHHPLMTQKTRLSERGGGMIIVDGLNIGIFKRRLSKKNILEIDLFISPSASAYHNEQALIAAEHLGQYLGQFPVIKVY